MTHGERRDLTMRKMRWIGLVLAAAIAMGTATACSEDGTAEKAGKALDEAADDAKESADEAKKKLEDAFEE
jgi:hypothetical protein